MEDCKDGADCAWFNRQLGTSRKHIAERVRCTVADLVHYLNPATLAGAGNNSVLECIKWLENNNDFEIVQDRDRGKNLVSKRVNKVEPPGLHERLKL